MTKNVEFKRGKRKNNKKGKLVYAKIGWGGGSFNKDGGILGMEGVSALRYLPKV
jgi:hypothetical protein